MKLKFILLVTLTILLQSCNGFEVLEIKLLENRSPSPTHDLCSEQCSVLLDGNSCYNTEEGTAILYIPVPKGNKLTFQRFSNNEVFFVSTSTPNTGPVGFDTFVVRLGGLDTTAGAELGVYVDIQAGLSCVSRLTDDKKGSVIAGYPITPDHQDNCDVECVDHP